MRKTGLFLLTMLLAVTTVIAQPDRDHKHDRIKALKIAYITEKLDLTSEQAQKFWPVYNRYEKEKWDTRRKFFDKYRNENPTASRDAAREYLEANLDYQENELELKKKYKDELLKTITAEQLVELYNAETGFRQMLIKELGKRHGPPPSGSKGRK
ncbi:MAG: hypothetical protein H6550_05450 [Chitinophagales bacterium]|nr:hypothetical protein [Chitinophagales bacterium]